ncbi:helix-turn-helix domain-containing protein [Spirosoma rhododendri]|uniref:Helix-turn-helix transcriptional regulator n=1 Tax=Spirosoma rhododendri TaxID=2728024 RepID=A0A7L5DYE6_9BACT|nr:helix-turn-helix transcriptional regulator [Spirosoma rhododendri]QJD81638.1 helix-turn-helix transcriptional regulator [Spirosoma rhododendri]
MAKLVFDANKLGVMIRQQRAGRSYREIADELGTVSASTLYRLESNHFPDMHVFTRICEWLNVSPNTFFIESDSETGTATYSQAKIVDLIRSDPSLTLSAAQVLSALVTAAYQTCQSTSIHT